MTLARYTRSKKWRTADIAKPHRAPWAWLCTAAPNMIPRCRTGRLAHTKPALSKGISRANSRALLSALGRGEQIPDQAPEPRNCRTPEQALTDAVLATNPRWKVLTLTLGGGQGRD